MAFNRFSIIDKNTIYEGIVILIFLTSIIIQSVFDCDLIFKYLDFKFKRNAYFILLHKKSRAHLALCRASCLGLVADEMNVLAQNERLKIYASDIKIKAFFEKRNLLFFW